LKSVLGRLAYLVAGAANVGDVEPRRARIRAPEFDRTIAFYLLAIGNGRCAGGGVPVCPDASPTDGMFDVTIVPEGAVGSTLGEILDKGMEGLGDAGIRFRCPWIEVESDVALQLNLDGEPTSRKKFRFEVNPRALRVLLPPDCPLLEPRGCGEIGEIGEAGEAGEISPSPPPSDRCAPEPRPA
jgi:diacylglycerol kinase family enzyme